MSASLKAWVCCVVWCVRTQEVEDLMEYYLQRASAAQSEAERLLAGG